MEKHVFMDNSNIFGGAQRTARLDEPTVPWQAIRLHFRNFAKLIEGREPVLTRVLGGSIPPGNEDLWEYARRAGYDTSLLRKIELDDGRLVEQGVDEILHLKIANVLLDYYPPQTLVLCTGDGKLGEFQTSFEHQAARALKLGWDVEVWSWGTQLSGRFAGLRSPSDGTLTIHELDPYYRNITFVKGGMYPIGATLFSVTERPVEGLIS